MAATPRELPQPPPKVLEGGLSGYLGIQIPMTRQLGPQLGSPIETSIGPPNHLGPRSQSEQDRFYGLSVARLRVVAEAHSGVLPGAGLRHD